MTQLSIKSSNLHSSKNSIISIYCFLKVSSTFPFLFQRWTKHQNRVFARAESSSGSLKSITGLWHFFPEPRWISDGQQWNSDSRNGSAGLLKVIILACKRYKSQCTAWKNHSLNVCSFSNVIISCKFLLFFHPASSFSCLSRVMSFMENFSLQKYRILPEKQQCLVCWKTYRKKCNLL